MPKHESKKVAKLVFRKRHTIQFDDDVIALANAVVQGGKWEKYSHVVNAAMRRTFRPLAEAQQIPLINYPYDQVALTPFKFRRKAA